MDIAAKRARALQQLQLIGFSVEFGGITRVRRALYGGREDCSSETA